MKVLALSVSCLWAPSPGALSHRTDAAPQQTGLPPALLYGSYGQEEKEQSNGILTSRIKTRVSFRVGRFEHVCGLEGGKN